MRTLVSTRTVDLRVSVPEPGTTLAGLTVRVYRNTRLLATQQDVTKVGRIKVRDVPLRHGANKLTATLANGGGEGPRSAVVTLNVDDQAPKVTVKTPRNNTVLNAPSVTIRGKTDDGLMVIGRNTTSDSKAEDDRRSDRQLLAGRAPGPGPQPHQRR